MLDKLDKFEIVSQDNTCSQNIARYIVRIDADVDKECKQATMRFSLVIRLADWAGWAGCLTVRPSTSYTEGKKSSGMGEERIELS